MNLHMEVLAIWQNILAIYFGCPISKYAFNLESDISDRIQIQHWKTSTIVVKLDLMSHLAILLNKIQLCFPAPSCITTWYMRKLPEAMDLTRNNLLLFNISWSKYYFPKLAWAFLMQSSRLASGNCLFSNKQIQLTITMYSLFVQGVVSHMFRKSPSSFNWRKMFQ